MTDTNRNTVTGASSTSASEASTAPTSQTNTPPSVDTIPKSTSYPTSINAPLPYWLVNVPAHLHSSIPSCPPFLAGANAKDRGILCTPDSDYRLMTWQEVCDIISSSPYSPSPRNLLRRPSLSSLVTLFTYSILTTPYPNQKPTVSISSNAPPPTSDATSSTLHRSALATARSCILCSRSVCDGRISRHKTEHHSLTIAT